MSEQANRCLNCDAALGGEYCSSCGQRDLPSRLAVGELLREVLSEIFELDGRVVRTIVPFLFRPGFLTREYVRGRRVRYTSPFRLFLAATLLWLFASFIAGQRIDYEGEGGDESIVSIERVEAAEQAEQAEPAAQAEQAAPRGRLATLVEARGRELDGLPVAEQARRFVDAGREALPQAALLTIPIFALLMQLLFIRQRRYYVEHLVFALHVHAFAFVLLALAVLLSDDLLVLGVAGLVGVYAYVALWRAYEVRWWTSALRLLTLGVVHSLVLAVASAALILAKVLMG